VYTVYRTDILQESGVTQTYIYAIQRLNKRKLKYTLRVFSPATMKQEMRYLLL
jgi:hypothetical protein